MYCTQANLMNISTIKKVPDLTSCRVSRTQDGYVGVLFHVDLNDQPRLCHTEVAWT